MTEQSAIIETSLIQDLMTPSVEAIISLWDDGLKTFWRSTEHRDRDKGTIKEGFFPTVTFCCLEALSEFRIAFPYWPIKKLDEVITLCGNVVSSLDIDRVDSSIKDPDWKLSPFTLARYIHSLGALGKTSTESEKKVRGQITSAARKLTENNGIQRVLQSKTNRHPFVIFHVFRACNLSKGIAQENAETDELSSEGLVIILGYVRKVTNELLARNALGLLSASDAVALIFCAATLALSSNPMDYQFIVPALRTCFERQDSSGCWPLGRVVSENKDQKEGRLEISTYEIAWALTVVTRRCLDYGQSASPILSVEEARLFLKHLVRAARYARGTMVRIPRENPSLTGWCTDHPFGSEMIESWTSSSVLLFSLTLNDLIEKINSLTALETFKSVASSREENWPKWLRWKQYREVYEPDTECPILEYIETNMIQVVQSSRRQLPSAENRSVSALLFGPPGTQKTSIVKAVADSLRWPIVSLSPGDFIEKGLEYIEAQASSVFNRLHSMSQTVVLFDECDELFRKRTPAQESEQTRGIAAFVTATMLPKLQDLHDRGRVMFFICTNHFDSMDKAVTRGGRVGHVIAVGPPDRTARLKFIRYFMEDRAITAPEPVVEEIANKTELFTIPELKYAVQVMGEAFEPTVDVYKKRVHAIVDSMKDSLTISEEDYKKFEDQKEIYSHPHIKRRARK
ncbi:MAG: ATP-dependent zinc metalloprotease FtsH [Syntrophomonadaceae bacterium]|nr:ATP-dependent zinc metalloprotease FtsH [Bacillota bacterium]